MQSQPSKGFSEALALAYTMKARSNVSLNIFCLPPSPLALDVPHLSLLFLISHGFNSCVLHKSSVQL